MNGCNLGQVQRNEPAGWWIETMWRTSLVIYLLLAAAAGNSPCCCAAARWSGWIATWGLSAVQDVEAPRPFTPECCGHRAESRTDRGRHAADSQPLITRNGQPSVPACDCHAGACVGELSRTISPGSGNEESSGPRVELPTLVTEWWDADFDGLKNPRSVWRVPPPLTGRETRICHCSWHC
jgi:hypothetical protein